MSAMQWHFYILQQGRTYTTRECFDIATISWLTNVESNDVSLRSPSRRILCLQYSTINKLITYLTEPIVSVFVTECCSSDVSTVQLVSQLDVDVWILSVSTSLSLVTYIARNCVRKSLVMCQSLSLLRRDCPTKYVVSCTLCILVVSNSTKCCSCCTCTLLSEACELLHCINLVTTCICTDSSVRYQVWLILSIEVVLDHVLHSVGQNELREL